MTDITAVKWLTKEFHNFYALEFSNGTRNQVGIANLISDKINFKLKYIRADKFGPCILINLTIKKKHITLLNIYAPNSDASSFIKMYYWIYRQKLKSTH